LTGAAGCSFFESSDRFSSGVMKQEHPEPVSGRCSFSGEEKHPQSELIWLGSSWTGDEQQLTVSDSVETV
jgi:hypothetical protein